MIKLVINCMIRFFRFISRFLILFVMFYKLDFVNRKVLLFSILSCFFKIWFIFELEMMLNYVYGE